MRAVVACLVVVAGCGRLAFDPTSGDARESDGGDDAGAGSCAPFDVTIAVPSALGTPPIAVAWTGREYVVLALKNSAWALIPVGGDGAERASFDSVLPNNHIVGRGPSGMAWSGTGLGLASTVAGNVLFRTLDPVSGAVGAPIMVNTTLGSASSVAIVWTGDRYLVAWAGVSNVYVRELDATGTPLTTELLPSTTGGNVTSLASSSTHYVVGGLNSGAQPYVVAVDRATMTPITSVIDSPGTGGTLVVKRSDDSFAATSTQVMDGKLQLLGMTGLPTGLGVTYPISSSTTFQLALQPTALGYRVTTETVGSTTHDVDRVELDSAGAMISSQPVTSFNASVAVPLAALSATDRSLLVISLDVSSNPYHLRLIQTCP